VTSRGVGLTLGTAGRSASARVRGRWVARSPKSPPALGPFKPVPRQVHKEAVNPTKTRESCNGNLANKASSLAQAGTLGRIRH
jgi:hypothetical protein